MEVLEKVGLFSELIKCEGNISTWCYSANGTLLFSNCSEQSFLANAFELFDCKKILLKYCEGHKKPFTIGTSFGMQWIAVFEKLDDTLKHIWLIGPIFYQDLNLNSIEQGLKYYDKPEINNEWKIKFFEVIKTIPVLPSLIVARYALMLHYCANNEYLKTSDLNNNISNINMENVTPINKNRHKVWMAEQGLLEAVRLGDTNYQQALSESMSISSGVPIHAEDALRQSKTSIVVFVSLVCRAAIEGGLSPEEAYSLNDNYIQTVESSKTLNDLYAIPRLMYQDFINRVHRCRQSNKISAQIQQCVDYISKNLDKKICAKDLASIVGYTEYYLTNKFKKEMGKSVNEYIKERKIERAQTLLRSTDLSIQEISDSLGFNTRNYFSNVFLKQTGKTPVEYRENR